MCLVVIAAADCEEAEMVGNALWKRDCPGDTDYSTAADFGQMLAWMLKVKIVISDVGDMDAVVQGFQLGAFAEQEKLDSVSYGVGD